MQATNISLDGSLIASSGVQITQADWRRVTTADASRDLEGKHGRTTGATLARVRIITLEGIVDRLTHPTAGDFTDVKRLDGIFSLQWDPSSLTAKMLTLTDPYSRIWTLAVKIREPIEWQEWFEEITGSHWRWRVVLESVASPAYLKSTESVSNGIEGSFWGTTLPVALGTPLSAYIAPLTCVSAGNTPSPARVVITATGVMDTPIKIRNRTTSSLFTIDTSMAVGDILIVDSERQKVTKNGVDISGLRRRGSVYPSVSGTTLFGIEDLDGAAMGVSECTVSIYFKEALL